MQYIDTYSLVLMFFLKAVINVDLIENEEADFNTAPNTSVSLAEQGQQLSESVGQWLGTDKLSAILCVAGGWAGGHAGSQGKKKKREQLLVSMCS